MSDIRTYKGRATVRFTAMSIEAEIIFVTAFDHLILTHTVAAEDADELIAFFKNKGLTIEGE